MKRALCVSALMAKALPRIKPEEVPVYETGL
jgi:hypothetical protein